MANSRPVWVVTIAALMTSFTAAQTLEFQVAPNSATDPFGLLSSEVRTLGAIEQSEFDVSGPATTSRVRQEPSALAVWTELSDDSQVPPMPVRLAAAMQPLPQRSFASPVGLLPSEFTHFPDSRSGQLRQRFVTNLRAFDVGVDFYSEPEFEGGLIIGGDEVAMKLGGYVKVDFIYDANPIDSTDSFVTTSIPVDVPDRTNFRAHARQTRLSSDTRWKVDGHVVRMFVEGDFFSDGNAFRLRHAYGEFGSLVVGRTWTTFTDVAAAPATIDFEGSVSSVNRRQAQARWSGEFIEETLKWAVAIEDTSFIVLAPPDRPGDARSPSPDFVAHVRLVNDWGQFQIAGVYRNGGFQPTGEKVFRGTAWGVNTTGVVLLLESTKAYYQILVGDGIGSFRGLPDAAPISPTDSKVLPLFGWMVGLTHEWNDRVSSNLTFAKNDLQSATLQEPQEVAGTSYLAVNCIWSPLEHVKVGVEYLFGTRQNVDFSDAEAHRLQSAVVFILP